MSIPNKPLQGILRIINIAFATVIVIIWLDELLDLPYRLLLGVPTPVNLIEAVIETILIVIVWRISYASCCNLLNKINILEGMLPICSSCKKIRNDQQQWEPVEQYVSAKTQASFTHSLCPDCLRKLYPEKAEKIIRMTEQAHKNRDNRS